MKSSENLFNLISSLSKAEKRYLTINSFQKSGNKNYYKLFREIEAQAKKGCYNEELIKTKFRNEKFIKQLTFTKNYLYNLIVKSLVNYYTNDNLEARIYNLILSAKIFFNKALFNDYFRNLETAKILAERTEKFGILLDIIKLQMKLIKLKDRKKHKGRNLYKEEAEAIRRIENISSYSKLLNTFYNLTKIPDYARSKILYKETLKIFESPLLKSEKNALSVTAKNMLYTLLIFKNEMSDNKKELFTIAVKRYEMFLENPDVFRTGIEHSEIGFLYSVLYNSVLNGKNSFFKLKLNEFKKKFSVNSKNASTDSEELMIYNLLLMHYFYQNNAIHKASFYAEKIFINMRKNEAIQNKDELFSFYFLYLKILFEGKKYLEALEIANIILKHEYKNVRYDILSYTYLLELFIHYELNNYQLIGSYIRALKKKLSAHKEKDLSEKIILNFFGELISEKRIDEKFILKKFLAKFETLKKNKYEKAFFSEFPIDKWVSIKILKNALDK